ncbi:MAG: hypothetical protein AVO34_02430 [Firmicutes bacterium ML8_F2]|nr:MAG: hypothetical protein AVO34_02430 [Firmicutes bacterium ML8_F2]
MLKLWKVLVAWTHWRTLLAATWRFLVAVFDWRTVLRRVKGQPLVDTVFVTNMRDKTDRRRYLGLWRPKSGHFNGPRYWINGTVGRTRALDIVTEDLYTSEGRQKAKDYFIDAVQWAKGNGAKVILLAASTKRLFGEDANQLRKLFPDLTFTIGDNGTFYLLREETLRALENAGLKPGHCRIAILGPYGFLGEMMIEALIKKGYDIIGAGPNISALKRITAKYGIDTYRTFAEMNAVDAVVACTHSKKIRLTAESVKLIRRPNRKLLVIDVAEPSNLKYREFQRCKEVVIRQDAGNAYSPKLKYVLGAISYRMFRLTRGVTFGCFAEALSIASEIKQGKEVEA